MQNYLETVTAVLQQMKSPNSPCKDIQTQYTCYSALFKHYFTENVPFSMETALEWLESKKPEISYVTYASYRKSLLRLDHYLLFGDINVPFYVSDEAFFCRSGMSESFFRLTYELEDYYRLEQSPTYYHTYSVAIKEFFKAATSMGVTEPEAITIDTLIGYWDMYCVPQESIDRRRNAVCAMTALMKYLHQRGDVPCCYQSVLINENAETIRKMKIKKNNDTMQPSLSLESKMDAFLSALGDWKYKESSLKQFRNDFQWYFMFLEVNHLSHSEDSIDLWSKMLSDSPIQYKNRYSLKDRRCHTIRLFDRFLKGCMESNMIVPRPREADNLPDWSRKILAEFIESRRQDGMTEKTLVMCRAAGCNFFSYLKKIDVSNPLDITPEVIKQFHAQDYHTTPESKNAYSVKLRQLLNYMADSDLIPYTLPYAVSTTCAPRRTIVNVLSDEMIEKIFEFRDTASSPLELRDVAMVMLGLRMGIRGIDILHLKISDFDWKSRTLSFVQRKNRKAITLPVPTDVGNSVYKYITQGRPESAEEGDGYVFIRHMAPYINFSDATVTCKYALKRILAAYNMELEPGQGFHITRRTFATQMLRADNRLNDISDALGHAHPATAEVYLERDEKNMRRCPLGFGGVL